MTDRSPSESPRSPAVAHAAAILRHMSAGVAEGVTGIARAVGMNPSSCFNILRTLEAERLVTFDPASKTYALGGGLVTLARKALDPDNAYALAQPRLARLARETGATCTLWRVLPENRILLLGAETNGQATRIHLEVGQRLPLPLGAAGRSVLAALDLPPAEVAALFEAVRWDRAPGLAGYLEELRTSRQIGWSVDDGAYLGGVTSVASPICDDQGRPRLSVSTIFFSGQLPQDVIARMGEATLIAAVDLAEQLFGVAGGRP